MAVVPLPTPRMAYCQTLLQCSGHGQQELTFYLPLTALGREEWDCSRLCLTKSLHDISSKLNENFNYLETVEDIKHCSIFSRRPGMNFNCFLCVDFHWQVSVQCKESITCSIENQGTLSCSCLHVNNFVVVSLNRYCMDKLPTGILI
jgi:hypothetical protein